MHRELRVYSHFSRGVPHYADLLQVASPESIGDYLSFVASMAREQLLGRPNAGLTLALELGDVIVSQLIACKAPINFDGKVTPITGKIIEVADPLALLPIVAMRIQETTALVDMDDKYNLSKVTFRQFCCIVSLAHIYRLRMSLDDSPTGVRAHHGLLAASAYGLSASEPVITLSTRKFISDRARRGGNARVAKSDKAIDKDVIRNEFDAWQRGEKKYKNSADFARKMIERPSSKITTTKTIEGWVTQWFRENRSDRQRLGD